MSGRRVYLELSASARSSAHGPSTVLVESNWRGNIELQLDTPTHDGRTHVETPARNCRPIIGGEAVEVTLW